MQLKTADLVKLCNALDLDMDEIAAIAQPCTHMRMAQAIAQELSELTYEEAHEIIGDSDGEIWVKVSERQPRLYLAPGVRHTPGDGLPTLEEQWQAEIDYALAVNAEIEAEQE